MAETAESYHYSVEWNENEIEFWARVTEFPSLHVFEPTREAALSGIQQLVADILADMARTGETPPPPAAN